jgi:hypothetical protein
MAPMYFEMFSQARKQLGQLDGWLTAAATHAKTRGFDPNVFLASKLAPDQFAVLRQVQLASDVAIAASRLVGKEIPKHDDKETSFEELHARLRASIAYLDGLSAKDFEGAATRVISHARWDGKVMSGQDYFIEHAVPNFFFHLTTAYAILRHAGVELGKKDYLGALTKRAP